MDLSIIVPVYNTPAASLTRCFDTLQFHKAITFEVIVVDDGSEEKTGAFCRQYAREHEFVRYVYQENRGVSAARNAGIGHANGTYVTFLDADDMLICENLLPEYLNGENDMILCDLERHGNEHISRMRIFECAGERPVSKKECLSAACKGRMNSACGRLFRRQMLIDNGLAFDEQMLTAEDAVFMMHCLQLAEKIHYGKNPIYRYFHSYDSGNGRLIRFPQQIFENLTLLYNLRNEMLLRCGAQWGLDTGEMGSLKAASAGLFVHAVFESISLLVKANVDSDEAYQKVRGQIIQIESAAQKQFSLKVRMKYWVVKYDLTWLMKLFARLRKVYLRVKR